MHIVTNLLPTFRSNLCPTTRVAQPVSMHASHLLDKFWHCSSLACVISLMNVSTTSFFFLQKSIMRPYKFHVNDHNGALMLGLEGSSYFTSEKNLTYDSRKKIRATTYIIRCNHCQTIVSAGKVQNQTTLASPNGFASLKVGPTTNTVSDVFSLTITIASLLSTTTRMESRYITNC